LKQKFDFIYIDGDHRYEGVKRDIELAIPLLKPGGVMLLDDYGITHTEAVDLDDGGGHMNGEYGVKQAADELLKNWRRVHDDIPFNNGARAYKKPK